MVDAKPFKWTLVLDNTGSTARDHLANERTFLAWLRTSLTLVTVGVAITQFSQHAQPIQNLIEENSFDFKEEISKSFGGKVIGMIYAVVGLVFGMFGIARYFIVQNNLVCKRFQASRLLVTIGFTMVLGLALAMVLSFWL